MSAYSSSITKYDNKWRVDFRYISPKDGKVKQSCKRGFLLRREALEWEKNELPEKIRQLETPIIKRELTKEEKKKLMTFEELSKNYLEYIKLRKRTGTYKMKLCIFEHNLLPFFKDKVVSTLEVEDIEEWQNLMLSSISKNGKPYAPTTLRSYSNQLSAVLNYAKSRKIISTNPVLEIERIGKKDAPSASIWTLEEYLRFREAVEEKPEYYYAYEVFFWTGLRLGEVLGLISSRVDCDNNFIMVEEQFVNDNLGELKTSSSLRPVSIPQDLSDKLREYKKSIYGLTDDTRLFTMSKSSLHNIKDNACKKIGLKRITLHQIRHSHISLLVNSVSSASIADVAKRAGHQKVSTTLTLYTHAYAGKDVEIAKELNSMMGGNSNVAKK